MTSGGGWASSRKRSSGGWGEGRAGQLARARGRRREAEASREGLRLAERRPGPGLLPRPPHLRPAERRPGLALLPGARELQRQVIARVEAPRVLACRLREPLGSGPVIARVAEDEAELQVHQVAPGSQCQRAPPEPDCVLVDAEAALHYREPHERGRQIRLECQRLPERGRSE